MESSWAYSPEAALRCSVHPGSLLPTPYVEKFFFAAGQVYPGSRLSILAG